MATRESCIDLIYRRNPAFFSENLIVEQWFSLLQDEESVKVSLGSSQELIADRVIIAIPPTFKGRYSYGVSQSDLPKFAASDRLSSLKIHELSLSFIGCSQESTLV